jgi:hypothetical protein
MTFKKLQKTLRRTLIAFVIFIFLIAFFWLTGILSDNQIDDKNQIIDNNIGQSIEKCVRPIEASILIPKNKTFDISLDTKKWNLEISEKDIIKIQAKKIIPLEKGRAEIRLNKKNDSGCSFVVEVFVVNFNSFSKSGIGRL